MMRHRKGRDVQRPPSPVRFEAGNHWRRKRRVGEAADCDPQEVRCDGDFPVHGRTALRAEVIRGPPAVAGAKRGRLPAVAGKRPRRRLAFYRHVLDRKPRLHAEHAARPPLTLVALAQGYALWVGTVVGKAELSAIARRLTGGHFPSCSYGQPGTEVGPAPGTQSPSPRPLLPRRRLSTTNLMVRCLPLSPAEE